MQGKDNTEEFLKKRLDNLGSEFQGDWNVFEQKLSKAVYRRRLRRGMMVGTFTIALIFIFAGVNVFQIFRDRTVYIPRDHIVNTSTVEEKVGPAETISPSEPVEPTQSAANDIASISKSSKSILPTKIAKKDLKVKEVESVTEPNKIVTSTSFVEEVTTNKAQENQTVNELEVITSIADNASSEATEKVVYKTNIGGTSIIEDASLMSIADASDSEYEAPIEVNKSEYTGDKNSGALVSKNSKRQNRDKAPFAKFNIANKLLKHNNFGSSNLGIRIPAPAIDLTDEDSGPYVSPLQEKNPWGYSFNVYPNFTFRKFEEDPNKQEFLHVDFGDAVEAAESGGFSLNLGFEVSRRIGPITYLNTGIEYISYKTDVLYNFTNFREAVFNNTNEYIASYRTRAKEDVEEITFSDKNVYHYVNFPLVISHQPWATDHIRFNIEAGASFLYFIGANGQTLDYQTLEVIDLSERDFKNSIGSLSFKIGVSYFVSDNLNVGFEPTLMYFTNTIYNDDYPFYVIPYSVGMNLNLQVKLN